MTTAFTELGWDDYGFWEENDKKIVDRINDLIRDIQRDPFKGLGKPEPLRGNLTGYWCRRITDEHRLVYRVQGKKPNQVITVIQAQFHYND